MSHNDNSHRNNKRSRTNNNADEGNSTVVPSGFHAAITSTTMRVSHYHQNPPAPLPGVGGSMEAIPYQYDTRQNQQQQHQNQRNSNYPNPPQSQQQQYHSLSQSANLNPSYRPPAVASSVAVSPKSPLLAATIKRPRPSYACPECGPSNVPPFDTEQALQAHRSSHIQCQACDFTAGPKVVKAHYQATHGTFSRAGFKTITVAVPGCPVQKFAICVGNRPEDVQAWIAERKRKFPRRRKTQPEAASEPLATDKSPLASLLAGYGTDSSDEEQQEHKEKETSAATGDNVATEDKRNASTKNADSTNDYATTQNQPSTTAKTKQGICHAFAKHGRCRRGAACPYRHDASSKPQASHHNKNNNRNHHHSQQQSLLRKLLHHEVEREMGMTVSLLKYLVDSRFLKDGEQK